MRSESEVIPENVWSRWRNPKYDALRQAVLVFGGSLSKEAVIMDFSDVSLAIPFNEETTLVKGILYLTTSRLIFLPRNVVTHENIVHSSYKSLRGLSGIRSSLSISLVDEEGATAGFQFPTSQSLFQCFNLLRALSKAARMNERTFRSTVARWASAQNLDETPFSSLEIELSECHQTVEVSNAPGTFVDDESEDPLVNVLAPMKQFFDYCNKTNFDIHTKLRFLFVLAMVSFCLKYIPFYPFAMLCLFLCVVVSAWKKVNQTSIKREKETEVPEVAKGFVNSQRFVSDWLFWRNPRKSWFMFKVTALALIFWLLMPHKVYAITVVAVTCIMFWRSATKTDFVGKIGDALWHFA